uniref:Mitochondrial ribosomal protein S24 n=1 Tax=Gasterosteus aculeatus aculeatus TaxID=481459 RepID=G3NAX3_GASAC
GPEDSQRDTAGVRLGGGEGGESPCTPPGHRRRLYLSAFDDRFGNEDPDLHVGVVLGPAVVLPHGAVVAVGVRLELLLRPGSSLRSGSLSRGLHVTAARCKNRAARVRVGKGDRPLTYEEALPPHHIAHRKGWLSQHTGNLRGEEGTAERTVEDVFVRRFIFGTFHGCLANELVIKRRGNVLVVCALMLQKLQPQKFYFLIGYSETMLSHLYKCPVKLEVQTLQDKAVYKYL